MTNKTNLCTVLQYAKILPNLACCIKKMIIAVNQRLYLYTNTKVRLDVLSNLVESNKALFKMVKFLNVSDLATFIFSKIKKMMMDIANSETFRNFAILNKPLHFIKTNVVGTYRIATDFCPNFPNIANMDRFKT